MFAHVTKGSKESRMTLLNSREFTSFAILKDALKKEPQCLLQLEHGSVASGARSRAARFMYVSTHTPDSDFDAETWTPTPTPAVRRVELNTSNSQ